MIELHIVAYRKDPAFSHLAYIAFTDMDYYYPQNSGPIESEKGLFQLLFCLKKYGCNNFRPNSSILKPKDKLRLIANANFDLIAIVNLELP